MRWHEESPNADVTSDGIALPRTAQVVETVTYALRHAAAGPPLAVLMADLASAGTDWRAPGVDATPSWPTPCGTPACPWRPTTRPWRRRQEPRNRLLPGCVSWPRGCCAG